MFKRKHSEIEKLENENLRLLALNRKGCEERKKLTEEINNLQKNRPRTTDEDVAQSMRDAIYSCAQRISENGGVEYAGFGTTSTTGVMALSQLVTTYVLFKTAQCLNNNQNAESTAQCFESLPEPVNAADLEKCQPEQKNYIAGVIDGMNAERRLSAAAPAKPA